MSGIMSMVLGAKTAIAAAVDAYFNLTTLLLPGDGTNGAQNNTFLDSSSNNFSITRNGNTTQGTFSPFSQTGWSNYFNGTNSNLTYPNNTAFAFGTGAFTIEFWINGPSNDGAFILGGRSAIGTMHITTGGTGSGTTVSCLRYVGSSTITSGSTLITNNSWNHCAIVRDGSNNITLYVNGVSVGTGTDTTNYTTTSGTWYIGQNDSGSANYLQGYISNLRIVKGTAVYTSAFTPPTTPLTAITNTSLLTCQSNRFIDNSSNAFAITVNGTPSVQAFSPFAPTAAYSAATNGGSGYFDGTGDYLTSTVSSIGSSGNLTVEGWVYPTASGVRRTIFFIGSTGTFDLNLFTEITAANVLRFLIRNDSAVDILDISSTATVSANTWSHVAFVISSTSATVYLNGVSVATGTVSGTRTGTFTTGSIGALLSGSTTHYFTGYLSSFRYVKGTAVYTGAFTPPTAPLTAITNTSLLLSCTNAGITDATAKNVLETVGNAQISTTQSKWGGASMYFDGTSDGLYIPANSLYAFGTGDFTIEFWMYSSVNSLDTYYRRIYMTDGPTGNASGNFQITIEPTTGKINLWEASGSLDILGTSNVTDGAWHHIAACRSGTTLRLFVDGTQQASTTYSTSVTANSGRPRPYIGTFDGTTGDYNGYLDDFRISRYARYTGNFTPPSAAFPLQ